MAFVLRKAERKKAKLKIGVFGPSGSGKTYSALLMAKGMAPWDKIAVIDTENGSAELYSHLGAYNVITLSPPFHPEKYAEAIIACEKAGMEVVIIDSITHEWNGTGGILEMADEMAQGSKNSFAVWKKLTPMHNRFIDCILQSPLHVICCGRTKQEYVLNQVERNGKTVNVPEKTGMKAMTRDGFDYEMTVAFDLAISHYATTSKDRSGIFMDKTAFKIGEDTGKTLLDWGNSGAADLPTPEQNERFADQLMAFGITKEQWEAKIGKKWDELSQASAEAYLKAQDIKIQQKRKDDGLPPASFAPKAQNLPSPTPEPPKQAEPPKRAEVAPDGQNLTPSEPAKDAQDNPPPDCLAPSQPEAATRAQREMIEFMVLEKGKTCEDAAKLGGKESIDQLTVEDANRVIQVLGSMPDAELKKRTPAEAMRAGMGEKPIF
jgi:hypothetical protein